MAKVFFSYSHVDEGLRDQLETHLALMKRQGVIEAWHDRRLLAGAEVDHGISRNLEEADIILLLVSADFLASDYCYSQEMMRALERHGSGSARVIPVILRPCDWHGAPFGKLLATPRDGRAVTSWPNRDEAFTEVARHIRKAVEDVHGAHEAPSGLGPASLVRAANKSESIESPPQAAARSSNLRLKKELSQLDRDRFLTDSFEFIARFFEASVAELVTRNPGVEGRYQRIDASRFATVLYRNGKAVAECSVGLDGPGGRHGGGIEFSFDASARGGSFNEVLNVKSDSQSLHFEALGMQSFGVGETGHLSDQGAAEHLWGLLIRPLQG